MKKSLSRDERLRTSRDIRELFSRAPRVETRGVKLLYRTGAATRTRFAVVIARGSGGAVERNREKRLTREAWRSLKGSVPGVRDVLFLVSRFGMTLAERRAVMAQLLGRAGLRGRQA